MSTDTPQGPQHKQVQHEWAELAINGIYGQPEDTQAIRRYCERHGVNSMLVLTIDTYYTALKEAEAIWPRIEGRTVVEIGAGVGMLALQMAKAARRVFAIEADPSWAWVFTEHLYALKPANLTYIFGAAAEVAGLLHADVAVVYTRSDVPQMLALAGQFAPEVIKGPLVGFADRHGITEEHEAFLERVIARLPKNSRTARGFSAEAISAAIRAELGDLAGRTQAADSGDGTAETATPGGGAPEA